MCESSADNLAKRIALVAQGSDSITLVCHSMGNLLARFIIESGKYSKRRWFKKITKYVGICGRTWGFPRSSNTPSERRVFLCITPADTKTISSNPDYQGGYQTLPFQGQPVLFDVAHGQEDFYKKKLANRLGLVRKNLDAALGLQKSLDFRNKPKWVHYCLIAGCDQSTDETIVYNGSHYQRTNQDTLGDGTIPLWSANIPQFHTKITPGSHIDVLKTGPFQQLLYQCLTEGKMKPRRRRGKGGVALSLDRFVYAPRQPIEVLAVADAGRTTSPQSCKSSV